MNLAFIPARCGSKSIPFKNIKLFCGKPLIYWNLKALEYAKTIDKVIVATDCDEIELVCLGFGFSKVEVFRRNSENASDLASAESVVIEFLNSDKHLNIDLFLLVQATSPFTSSSDFDNAIIKFNLENADSMLSVVNDKGFIWNKELFTSNYDINNRPRRQEFNSSYIENGAFYISTPYQIIKHNNRLSGKIIFYEMSKFSALELDEEADWSIGEFIMHNFFNNKKKPNSISDIKLFLSDVDGTLTDAGMYYGVDGQEFKKFNTHDGKGFEILKNLGIKTGLITSEDTQIVKLRAKKLKVDFLFQGLSHASKLKQVVEICEKEKISLSEVAYIGDDLNCKELLSSVGFPACPSNALSEVKNIPNIFITNKNGGDGAVREYIDYIVL